MNELLHNYNNKLKLKLNCIFIKKKLILIIISNIAHHHHHHIILVMTKNI